MSKDPSAKKKNFNWRTKAVLFDQGDGNGKVPCEVIFRHGSLMVKPEGYEDLNGGEPILIELYEGHLRVVAWADINQEDPTHTVDMEEAKETNRKED